MSVKIGSTPDSGGLQGLAPDTPKPDALKQPIGAENIGDLYDKANLSSLAEAPATPLGVKSYDANAISEKLFAFLERAAASSAGGQTLAGTGGEPPPPPGPGRDPLRGHYADTGPLPVKTLNLRMAQSPSPNIDPSKRSDLDDVRGKPLTRELALRQTAAARALLYQPGATLRQELGLASANLHAVVRDLPQDLQRALGGRLFGSEGLLPHRGPQDLLALLQRVAQDVPPGASRASAHDRAVVLALMGDIGALYADTGATTGVQGRSAEQAEQLRVMIAHLTQEMGLAPLQPSVRAVQDVGGSSAVGPAKKQERSRPEGDQPLRTGIHNVGEEVDDMLGVDEDSRLPPTRWDVAHINRGRVNTTSEPLVGHMSGSPAEILQVWDMLRGVPTDHQFIGVLQDAPGHGAQNPVEALPASEREALYARVAGADAFLVGLGYHSAVEVLEGTLLYTGQSLRPEVGTRQDAGHLFGHGAATDLVAELMQSHVG